MNTKVAALYINPRGPYPREPNVWAWDEKADARKYAGPYPVVAHPPCSRWCRLAGLVQARWGHRIGDDGGCFASALASVREWGGVLEHPAYSKAWAAHGLAAPNRHGGWSDADGIGFTCHVEQGRYGHPAKKATWLYAVGLSRDALPELRWGSVPDGRAMGIVSWCGNRVSTGMNNRPRVGKDVASRTPDEFRAVLIGIARAAGGT